MLFSGKGGVGKTTLAAATAVHLARQGSRVLVVSTDPAHSLSDVFALPLGAQPTNVAPRLDAMEVDAGAMFAADMIPQTDQAGPDRALSGLLRMASRTPGVDEFGAVEVLLQALENHQHDVVILDTAPTGHTLRLLMLPELLDGWLGTLLQLRAQLSRAGRLLKRFVPRSGKEAAQLPDLEHGLRGSRERIAVLRDLLTDPQRCQIFVVTIAEAMSVEETLRTLQLLRDQNLAVGAVIVNQLQPQSDSCTYCQHRRAMHQAELARLHDRVGDLPVRELNSLHQQISGCDELAALALHLWT